MRSVLLAFALALAGCLDTAPAAPPAAADADAFALLEAVDRDALADAFGALDAAGYRAERATTLFGPDGAETGTETLALARADGALTVGDRRATGALADADPPSEAPGVRDPLATALSDDPPYLDPTAREAYAVDVLGDTTIAGARFQLVEAVLADTTRELGVRRVWAAVGDGGRVGAVEVERTAASVLFRETTRVRVELATAGGTWVPVRVETDARTDVPLSPAVRVRTRWAIAPGGAD